MTTMIEAYRIASAEDLLPRLRDIKIRNMNSSSMIIDSSLLEMLSDSSNIEPGDYILFFDGKSAYVSSVVNYDTEFNLACVKVYSTAGTRHAVPLVRTIPVSMIVDIKKGYN